MPFVGLDLYIKIRQMNNLCSGQMLRDLKPPGSEEASAVFTASMEFPITAL